MITAIRMALGVGEGQGDTPRGTPDEPLLDPEVFAQPFDVGYQVVGRVGRQLGREIADVGHAQPTPALVELDEAIPRRIEPPSATRTAPAAGSAVEGDGRRDRRTEERHLPRVVGHDDACAWFDRRAQCP